MKHYAVALAGITLLMAAPLRGLTAEVAIRAGGSLTVGGEPFFPLFVWLQPVRLIDLHKSLGMNTLMGEGASAGSEAEPFLDALHEHGMYGVIHFREENAPLQNHPALLTWMFGDEPDLDGQPPFEPPQLDAPTTLIEAEAPAESTFIGNTWLVKAHDQLSGGTWLSATADAVPESPPTARYEFTVLETGPYALWDRGFMKAWSSPTRWRTDEGEWQTSPRDAKTVEGRKIAANQTVGWHRYGEVHLEAGEHVLEIAAGDGRTLGKPDAVGEDLLFGVDLFLLTRSDAEPSTPFEPIPRTTPDEIAALYAAKRAADPDRPVYLNLTSRFFEPYRKLPLETYDAYCAATDIVGYDHYPIYGWGRPDRIHEIAQATAALKQIAGPGKPVWAILECTNGGQWVSEDTRAPTPAEIKAEVWMAIINGATGIGYFPHVWKPEYQQCRIPEENREAIREVNALITELTGVILGEVAEGVTCESDGDLPVDVMAREGPDGTYVFAVNLLREERQTRFTVPEATAGQQIDVVTEDRQLTAEAGGFTDAFPELGVHIYRIATQ